MGPKHCMVFVLGVAFIGLILLNIGYEAYQPKLAVSTQVCVHFRLRLSTQQHLDLTHSRLTIQK